MCKRPIILAVDDDEDSLLLLIYALESLNCSIVTEINGRAALASAASLKPDLILLDIVLPDLYGMDCISLLKQNPETQHIPIIAVTALARAEEKEQILLMGCDAYVSKPYMLEDLESLIRGHLPCVLACPA